MLRFHGALYKCRASKGNGAKLSTRRDASTSSICSTQISKTVGTSRSQLKCNIMFKGGLRVKKTEKANGPRGPRASKEPAAKDSIDMGTRYVQLMPLVPKDKGTSSSMAGQKNIAAATAILIQ